MGSLGLNGLYYYGDDRAELLVAPARNRYDRHKYRVWDLIEEFLHGSVCLLFSTSLVGGGINNERTP